MKYNGWRNRATWNVHLWLSNDEGLYHAALRVCRPATVTEAAVQLKSFCADLWPNGKTPDDDALADISLNGWREIAAAFRD